ncbi:MAG: hypothetical protein F6K35_24200 [Okeania sp. SIO2H7]|nr:hypothetical protein [Okeania sp. SIO2H7]
MRLFLFKSIESRSEFRGSLEEEWSCICFSDAIATPREQVSFAYLLYHTHTHAQKEPI